MHKYSITVAPLKIGPFGSIKYHPRMESLKPLANIHTFLLYRESCNSQVY